jgi:hypothetical protein
MTLAGKELTSYPHDCWVMFSPPFLMAKTIPSQNQPAKVKINQSLSKSIKIRQTHVFTSMFVGKKSCYHLVMTNSLPWKIITIFKNGKPSISMGHLYHGYVSHNHFLIGKPSINGPWLNHGEL